MRLYSTLQGKGKQNKKDQTTLGQLLLTKELDEIYPLLPCFIINLFYTQLPSYTRTTTIQANYNSDISDINLPQINSSKPWLHIGITQKIIKKNTKKHGCLGSTQRNTDIIGILGYNHSCESLLHTQSNLKSQSYLKS